MSAQPAVSILINNYNYASFVADAIESALRQTHSGVEVVVVDDGSTDDSREVIARFDRRISPVLKANGGQASAFNAGFAASQGDIICLLDADDVFMANKVSAVVDILQRDRNLGWCFDPVQEFANETGEWLPRTATQLSGKLDVRAMTSAGKQPFVSTASSGLCFRRKLLGRILPMPEMIRITSDNYIKSMALGLAEGWMVSAPLTLQRIHGSNAYTRRLSGKDRLVGRTELLTGVFLHQKSPELERLGKNIFCRGLGKLWATGGVDVDCKELADSFLGPLTLPQQSEVILRAAYWGASYRWKRAARTLKKAAGRIGSAIV